VGCEYSPIYVNENETPQESISSPILFNLIIINNIFYSDRTLEREIFICWWCWNMEKS